MSKSFESQERRTAARQAILDFHELFSGTFLTCGTLLGLVRDGDVIPHDSDVDFGTIDWPFSPMPRQLGPFKLWKYFHHKGITSEIAYIHSGGVKVDLFRFFLEGDQRFFAAWPDEFPRRKTIIRRFPRELVEKQTTIVAYDTQLRVGVQPERFLELNYGVGWRKPDRNWDYRRSVQ